MGGGKTSGLVMMDDGKRKIYMKDEKIIEALRRRHRPDRTFTISRTIPKFFSGELVVADVTMNGAPLGENYVYISGGQIGETFLSMDDAFAWAGSRSARETFQNVAIISGIIALMITVTICIIVVVPLITGGAKGADIHVPEILSNALTIILGFYFGSQVAASKKPASELPLAPAADN
jgi:hypothetical protein